MVFEGISPIFLYILCFLCCFVSDILIYLYSNLPLIVRVGIIFLLNLTYSYIFVNGYIYIIYFLTIVNIISIPFIIIVNNYSFNHSTNYGWKKYSKFPVLGNIRTGSFFDPCVIKVKNEYWMYFSYRKKGDISLSRSSDGINWSNPISVLIPIHDTWESAINRASILYKNNKFFMWYTGQFGKKSSIGYAESEDGIIFKKYNQNPILQPELDFEGESIMNPDVIFDEKNKVFKMYYAAGEQYEPDCIGYAESSDGILWNKKMVPVLKKSNDLDSYDYFKVGATDVHILDNGLYIMFYIGYTDIHTGRIMLATSKDGIHWEKNKKFLIESTIFGFDGDSVYKPSVLFNKKENKWMMRYNGRLNDREYIGYAESYFGITEI